MSLREVPSSRPLLARKGTASPADLRAVKDSPAEPSLRSIEGVGEIALELANPAISADLTAGAAGEGTSESSPAASLLPFNLLRQKYRPEISPDLAEDEPDMVLGELAPAESAPGDRAEMAPPDARPRAEAAAPADPVPHAPAPALPPAAPPTLKVKTAAQPMLDFPLDARPRLRVEPRVAAPGQKPAAAPAPKPDPDWRLGAEAGVAAAPKRASSGGWLLPFGALAAAFAALVVGWSMTNPLLDQADPMAPTPSVISEPVAPAAQAPALAATGGTAGQTGALAAVEPAPPVAEAPPAPAGPVDAAADPSPVEAKLPQPALSTTPDAAASAGQTLEQPATAAENDLSAAPEKLAPGTSIPLPAAVEVPVTIKPTVDVVRLEANGEAVIAGRAAPNSELIVLDNGKPIGTARADAFGEWVFVPEAALPTGDHEFGLVLKTIQESVSLPAPSKPALPPAPAAEPAAATPDSAGQSPKVPVPSVSPNAASAAKSGSAPAVAPESGEPAAGDSAPAVAPAPVPVRRPAVDELGAAPGTPADAAMADASAVAPTADFVVQLASVKTRDGAQQEWRKLQQRFPDVLADMVPALDEVKLADYGTVVRVRTGAFASQSEAARLCARLASMNQQCLVVRVSAGN